MTHTPADYLAIVRTAVAESVGVDENEVEPSATVSSVCRASRSRPAILLISCRVS